MLKYELFRYNIVVAAYPVFVCIISRAGRHEKQRTQIQGMLPQQYYNEKVHILTRYFN